MIKEKLYSVELSLKELELLDKKVNEKAQGIIDTAKLEAGFGFELPIMNEILRESLEKGNLNWKYKSITNCSYCNKERDYHTYSRSSRYHNKGDKNYDSPKYYSGIKFNEGFITMQGYGDMCSDCEKEYNVIHSLIDYIIDNDLPIEIQKNDYKDSKYLKDEIVQCYQCKEEIKESEMGRHSTLMGDGTYPSSCPKCGAKSLPFGRSHNSTKKFGMILNPDFCNEVQEIKRLVKEYNNTVSNDNKFYFTKSKRDNGDYWIEEVEFKNGYRRVIEFNTNNKTFKVGYFYKNKDLINQYKNILINNKYKEKEK